LNIWLIQTGESLPTTDGIRKMRTALLADKLLKRKHNILWWASSFDHFKKDWIFIKDTELTVKEGLKIFALKGSGYKKNASFPRFIDHRIIAKKFKKLAKKIEKPDIIVASTPPYDLAYEAVMFSKKNDIPVLVDIRDEWPDLFLSVIPKSYRRFIKILLFNEFQMIKKTLHRADGLIAMMNPLLDWGLEYAGRPKTAKDRVFYLGAKKIVISNELKKTAKFLDLMHNKFVITFVGTLVQNNNPTILIDCAEKLIDSNILIIIAGDGELFSEIKNKALGLSNVFMPGWLNQDEVDILLKHSHLGVCPTSQLRLAFPNKAFSYLAAGLPIITAFQGDLKELIEKHEIGFYYPPHDVNALIKCIKKLYEDQMLYKKMSENASSIFDKMFDADKIYEEYAEHVEKVTYAYKRKNINGSVKYE
jgi:glycosyltransferase involved in cell wall biosynthesis